MTSHTWRLQPEGTAHDDRYDDRYDARYDARADCHRRLRGPYTGLGTLLRSLVPDAHRARPELVARHAVEILSAAPELKDLIGAGPQTLTSLAVPNERTRLYPAKRTRRLAHGIVEFLHGHARELGRALALRFDRVDEADHTDQEFLAILLRRALPDLLMVTVHTGGADLIPELTTALATRATRAADTDAQHPDEHVDLTDHHKLAQAYVESDGTSHDPAEEAAYHRLDAGERARLHDQRAAELRRRGDWSLSLGAIPYHLEHGSDREAAADAFFEAAEYLVSMGFYHALLDVAGRGTALVDLAEEPRKYWMLATKVTTALAILGRPEEAERRYIELRAMFRQPMLHIFSGYALAMLYTRYYPAEHKDHQLAKAHLHNVLAMASLLPDHDQRVFQSVFNRNGLALVELQLGNPTEALRLVSTGLADIDRELPAEKHRLHRSVLVHNRGRVYTALGRLEEALADIDTVIELDPNYPDYYFDRADLRRRMGDLPGALADYSESITFAAPFWEMHYNRADLRLELGDLAGAIADLTYVLDLEPDELDARINLASLLREQGDAAGSLTQVEEGLRHHPGDARLLSARGLLALDAGDDRAALRDFDLALTAEPDLVSALANRATLALETGDHGTAVADLTRALAIEADNPDLLYNRGYVHQSAGDWESARQDYTAALLLPGADRADLLRQRAECQLALGDPTAHQADLAAAESAASSANAVADPVRVS
ncbi:tetratricopeptide repeat protein [Kitasatospora sp. NPDC096140]|uniref:tetratricopeptide repeat protein n=1 Tax=Kitasatospora sp. NPDC096140 TaxID=3155425 RepID=UPI00332B629B